MTGTLHLRAWWSHLLVALLLVFAAMVPALPAVAATFMGANTATPCAERVHHDCDGAERDGAPCAAVCASHCCPLPAFVRADTAAIIHRAAPGASFPSAGALAGLSVLPDPPPPRGRA